VKVFMFNKDLAVKNNCYTEKDPSSIVKHLIIMISLLVCVALFGPIILLLLRVKGMTFEVLKNIIICSSIILIVYYIYNFFHWRAKFGSPRSTAIIKENNTFWAVRLTFIPEIGGAVNANTVTSVASAISNAKKAQFNQEKLDELYEDREIAEKYIDALNESRKSSARIMRDIDKNFKYIFNGRASVIRLDNIKFIKETKDSEIYSYINNNDKKKKIEIFKVYSGLKEEIMNTQQDEHSDKFPQFTEEHKETFKTNNKAIIVISVIAILLLVLGIKANNYDCSDRLSDSDKEYVYNYIESNYGAGETLNVYKEKISCFEKDDRILGTEMFVMGYFDSNETVYAVTFRKLDKEYFDYEVGKMIKVAEHHYNKSELNIK